MPGPNLAQRPNWPLIFTQAGFAATIPVVTAGTFILDDTVDGKLDTGTLGGFTVWSDISVWMRSGDISRAADRQQGPLYQFAMGGATLVFNNQDGRFDPDNLAGPYVSGGVTLLNAMTQIQITATWDSITYPVYFGYVNSWDDDGKNYAGHYSEVTVSASDGQKVLQGITLPTVGAVGAGEDTGARISRILDAALWYTGTSFRTIATGNSTVQAYVGGDTAWSLMQHAADAEIGDLYMNSAGAVTFRNRQAMLTETRSNTVQAVFGDAIGTVETAGTERPYTLLPRARDDTTLANDIQATRTGGVLQEVQDAASIATFLFPRSYEKNDLILQDDTTALGWAQWVLYVSKTDEDRFDTLVINPLRDPANLWPQVLGRKMGDRIQIWRRPPGVASPVVKDCFIKGIVHTWDWGAGTWQTTWTLQDANRYGSFLVLDNPTLGQLNSNAVAF